MPGPKADTYMTKAVNLVRLDPDISDVLTLVQYATPPPSFAIRLHGKSVPEPDGRGHLQS